MLLPLSSLLFTRCTFRHFHVDSWEAEMCDKTLLKKLWQLCCCWRNFGFCLVYLLWFLKAWTWQHRINYPGRHKGHSGLICIPKSGPNILAISKKSKKKNHEIVELFLFLDGYMLRFLKRELDTGSINFRKQENHDKSGLWDTELRYETISRHQEYKLESFCQLLHVYSHGCSSLLAVFLDFHTPLLMKFLCLSRNIILPFHCGTRLTVITKASKTDPSRRWQK